MAYDFRADQVRTNRIISDAARVLVYSSASAADYEGNLATSFDTGSVGPDVFFFVSGSTSAVSMFGGPLFVSGAMSASQYVGAGGLDTYVQVNENGIYSGVDRFTYNSGAVVLGSGAESLGGSFAVYGPGGSHLFNVTSSTAEPLYSEMEVIVNGLHIEPLYATLQLVAPTDSGSIPAQLLTGSGLTTVSTFAAAKCDLSVLAIDEAATGWKSWTYIASFAISGGVWSLMKSASMVDSASFGTGTDWSMDVKTDGTLDLTGSSGSNMSFYAKVTNRQILGTKATVIY